MTAHLEGTQTLCWHCEEVVHRYALYCPYCQKSLVTTPQSESDAAESKVMPILPLEEQVQEMSAPPVIKEVVQPSAAPQLMQPLLVAVLLLSSSFFFFFGVLVRFFSENGVLTLQWDASSWPYYLFPSVVGMALGYYLLYKIQD